ncbi:hypothetical protein V3C99_017290 [Haemonchus contortus]|uniref:Phosphatidylinositol-4-phosphate 3-kinase n=1 Tax=Haemonchus contortus TaxID=6289 RepID=A0A7I4Z846_HAECO|nr:Phosphoinositide 3-kinase and Phosphoinositide 3-kinase accessory region PIK and Phosphatidylinositol 3-4-kinase and Phox and C2 calcium-dependent membrane targeting domain containing protein [Haemonchus contortus]
MAQDYSDPELQLALELSKKTFEEEERRRNEGQDLIRFESPEAPLRREQIKQINRLFSQPSFESYLTSARDLTPSFNATSTTLGYNSHPQCSRTVNPTTLFPSSSAHSFDDRSYLYNTAPSSLPPLAPPLPPKTYHTTHVFPPAPDMNMRYDTPPPLPPRLHSTITSRSLNNIPSIYPALSASSSQRSASVVKDEFELFPTPSASDVVPYVNAELYVPYTMCSNRLLNGDLIDLGSSDEQEQCPLATLEQIRRDFDPLYRSPEKNVQIESTIPSLHVIETGTERGAAAKENLRQTPYQEGENKENYESEWLTLDCIRLEDHVPSVIRQIAIVKERGMKNCTSTSLYFMSPIADYLTTSALSVKVVVSKDYTWHQNGHTELALVCDTETSIDLLITQLLTDLLDESDLADGVPVEKYGLKIFGLDEFLPKTSALGNNLYVGNCILHGKDVKLEIGRFEPSFIRSSSPPPAWEKTKAQFKFSSVLDKEDIENMIVHLKSEMAEYEQAFRSSSTLSISASSNKVRQCVKMLCKLINSIEPMTLHQHLQNYLTATTTDQLKMARNDFIASLHSFISVYCQCTLSYYKLAPLRPFTKQKKEIINCKEKLAVKVDSVHNLVEMWTRDYSSFFVTVNVYYGTQVLAGHSKCISKTIKYDAFFPYIPINVYACFEDMLCTCPRETKIMFILSGIAIVPNASSGDATESTQRPLAFASLPLFDHEMVLRQGQVFIPLTVLKNPVLQPWGPYPLIANEKDPVLIVTLPTYDYIVVFPDVAVEFQSVKQDPSTLDSETQEYLMDLVEAGDTQKLTSDEQEMLWQKRSYLMHLPEALPLVLASVPDWGFYFLANVYQIIEGWVPLSPVQAMQLLLPQYPDMRIRQKAIEWIMCASSDFLFNALPQLVEALRFEIFESSSLAVALLTLSYKDRRFAFEIYWQLQQRIDHCVDFAYAQRCSLLQKELLERHEADHLRDEIARQHKLLNELDCIQMDLRREESDQTRLALLRARLGTLDGALLHHNVRLPCLPSFKCSGVVVKDCNIFNSNAKPLKIVFRGLNSTYSIIHKSGDDMRQDALVLQMVSFMNGIWLSEHLDLRMITFRCMPVGYRKGMAELVLDCATLCEIQKEFGVTGVFKEDILMNWLMKHNTTEFMYKQALDNFTRSCAGWCVATYVLGIGDRHNDNILVTTAGHVFHIDFGKYMGDWQTAGGFRRDRVPFVFTDEMYHVINGGNQQKESYQTFIDYCCQAFNYLRRNYTILANPLKMMACSDIAGMNVESLNFVEKNLMLELSETDAVIQFTQLINHSLKSAFPRINFFFHTLAQVMSSSGNSTKNNDNISFVPQLYTQATDGKISRVRVITFEKRFMPNKVYLYKVEVIRESEIVSSYVYRSFNEFNELYIKLRRRFPTVAFPALSSGTRMRSNVREVAQRRMVDVESFLRYLFTLSSEICHCDLVYTFFHLILRDSNIHSYIGTEESGNDSHRGQCEVYLKIQFNGNKQHSQLSIFVGHVKHLALLTTGQAPDAYVKSYIRPDPQNLTKKKTQVVKASQNPTFNREMYYDIVGGENVLSTRVLEVSVWNSGGLMDNNKLYLLYIPLQKLRNRPEDRKGNRVLEGWFAFDRNV